MEAGLAGDALDTAGLANTWVSYPAADGLPLTLDATKPITGEIMALRPRPV